ncbi:MAG TPA: hypothetical protein VEV16_05195 [Daejeonella sp.]|nr:hypothetical protein [Daejeonella sp.]
MDTMKNKWVGKDRSQTRTNNPQTSDTTRTRNGVAIIPGGGVKNGQTIGHVGATGYTHHHRLHHKYRHHVASTKAKHTTSTTKHPASNQPTQKQPTQKQPTPNP